MRHQHRDLSILDFPTANGAWIPDTSATALAKINAWRDARGLSDVDAFQIWLQMTHRFVALLIAIGVIAFCSRVWRDARQVPALKKLSIWWIAFLLVQLTLGAWTIWSNKAADIATAHVAVGAIMLSFGVTISAICWRISQANLAAATMPVQLGRAAAVNLSRMKTAAIEVENAKHAFARRRFIGDLFELVKARLTALVLLTTAVGFYLGSGPSVDYAALFRVVFGTAAAAAGAAALNQWWERKADALMNRTRMRPVPAGRMRPAKRSRSGLSFRSLALPISALACNSLSAVLAAITITIYIFGYTPLKRASTANTVVGAIPGAIPPVIGWAAARGAIDAGGVEPFRNSFAVAIAAFLRHCLDVSRRLFASGFSHDFKR